jgi:hypothetical protein
VPRVLRQARLPFIISKKEKGTRGVGGGVVVYHDVPYRR